jgi:hypothetical protein
MPPPTRSKKQNEKDALRFRVDGVEYTVDRSDITPRIERELFTQAGITLSDAGMALTRGALFGVAAMMFVARRQQGEQVAYQPIEDGLWRAKQEAGDEFDLTLLGADEEVVANPPG